MTVQRTVYLEGGFLNLLVFSGTATLHFVPIGQGVFTYGTGPRLNAARGRLYTSTSLYFIYRSRITLGQLS